MFTFVFYPITLFDNTTRLVTFTLIPAIKATRKPGKILYEEFLENLYDGIYFVNLEREITYWNSLSYICHCEAH